MTLRFELTTHSETWRTFPTSFHGLIRLRVVQVKLDVKSYVEVYVSHEPVRLHQISKL
jgi:hypothetical protein